jgi:hypothetical protein
MEILTDVPDGIENRCPDNIVGEIEVELEEGDLKPFSAEYLLRALERHAEGDAGWGELTHVHVGFVDYGDMDGHAMVLADAEDADTATIVAGRVTEDPESQS